MLLFCFVLFCFSISRLGDCPSDGYKYKAKANPMMHYRRQKAILVRKYAEMGDGALIARTIGGNSGSAN